MVTCPFCARIAAGDAEERNDSALAFPDGFPLSPGHTLIVPLRHEPDFWQLSGVEQEGMWRLVRQVRERLQRTLSPDGFNVGINAGEAAGQTVPHAHIHLIPRYGGDILDPRGGIRWVLPEKARYW
jgi:diadenosine tetraphosphate (Ap4A) HIT family hydrolase